MRASLTELKAICTKQTLPSEAEAPSRHHDASKLPDRHESEQRQRPDRFACCWEALVQALSFPAPGQARAHRAFRVASDPVKAVARRLDRLPLLGSRRSRPLAGESEFRSLADAATISTPAERPTAVPIGQIQPRARAFPRFVGPSVSDAVGLRFRTSDAEPPLRPTAERQRLRRSEALTRFIESGSQPYGRRGLELLDLDAKAARWSWPP
jgi:hypothetical protein